MYFWVNSYDINCNDDKVEPPKRYFNLKVKNDFSIKLSKGLNLVLPDMSAFILYISGHLFC